MEARKVKAENGWLWIKQGYGLFRQNVLLWIALTMIALVGIVLLASIPIVGGLLGTLLSPVLFGGLMLGCRAQEKGEELELAHLFAGFRQNTSQLITLGGLTLVGEIVTLGAMRWTGGAKLFDLMMNAPDDPVAFNAALEAIVTDVGAGTVLLALLVGGMLFCVLMMATAFAPMLVIFNAQPPVAALKASFSATLRNVAPLAVYGIIIILFAFVASLPMALGWLALLPVMVTSSYAVYRDLFPENAGDHFGANVNASE